MAFEANLSRLARRHPRLAERIANAARAAVAVERGPTGVAMLVEHGVRLTSAYDPDSEGRRLAASALEESPELVVAVGLGLGYGVDALRAGSEAAIIAFEPSLARWRALLETRAVDWLDADDVDCASELDELSARFQARYTAGLRARTCIQPVVARLDAGLVRAALERVAQAKRSADAGTVTRVAMMRTWSQLVVDNAPALLATPSAGALYGAFAGAPAVVVAAGPSLDRQLATLAREAERLLVVAIGQAYPALLRAGVRPDLVHVIESKDVSHQLGGVGTPDDLALVLYPSSHPSLFALPARARFVANPEPYKLACWIARARGDASVVPGGATVAQSAVHLAVALGATQVALVGQDLAFSGGRVYATGSAYDMVRFEESGDGRFAFTGLAEKKALLGADAPRGPRKTDALVWVEGFEGAPVPTSRSYAAFLENYRGIGEHLRRSGVALVNCTEGGARIPGIAHEPFADWIAAHAREPVKARERVDCAFASAPRGAREELDVAIAGARDALGRLECAARSGIRRSERAARSRGGTRRAAMRFDVLRGLARSTGRVHEALAELGWLDDLIQQALHELALAARRNGGSGGPRAAFDESTALLRAAHAGADGGRALLDRLERRLAATA